jgi:hypothetical protein
MNSRISSTNGISVFSLPFVEKGRPLVEGIFDAAQNPAGLYRIIQPHQNQTS